MGGVSVCTAAGSSKSSDSNWNLDLDTEPILDVAVCDHGRHYDPARIIVAHYSGALIGLDGTSLPHQSSVMAKAQGFFNTAGYLY